MEVVVDLVMEMKREKVLLMMIRMMMIRMMMNTQLICKFPLLILYDEDAMMKTMIMMKG